MNIYEGGNAIPESNAVNKEDVAGVISTTKRELPQQLLQNLQIDIGSAGYKVQSGDIDVMVDSADVVDLFKTQDSKDPVKEAKQSLAKFFIAKGIRANLNGRNVSIGIAYKEHATGLLKLAQVDVMVIGDVSIVAPYHQHGPRGMYSDTGFKGNAIFLLISSISKALGLKFDAFGAKLMRRDDNEVIARTRDEVAKQLFNATAMGRAPNGDDLNSVNTIMAALANDPDKEAKLAQARQDQAKGLISLPESARTGTVAWFSKLKNTLS